ncbi:MAG: hypothetical protein K0S56_1875 [Microvirga sp.]|jgi:hypothetical protein|nr:hypothetical protein [Microvirga sp.]
MNPIDPTSSTQAPTRKISRADFVGEAIDQLITIEAKNPGLPHNALRPMYAAARALASDRPLSMVAAEQLRKALRPGDTVLMLSGAGYAPQMPQGEDDGPPGVASLALALYRGLGAVPVYVSEACHAGPIVASSHAAGLMIKEFRLASVNRLGAALAVAPTEQSEVAAWVTKIFSEMRPKAIISAERLGPAKNGYLHNLTAQPYGGPETTSEHDVVDISPLIDEAKRQGVLTVGIGDHGNEIGFGSIWDTVAEAMPLGDQLCTTSATDILLPVMISNWGCYGIEAALAFLLGQTNLVHSPAQEERIIRACQAAGGIDAIFTSTQFAVDGLDGETSMACVQFLGNIVRKALEVGDRGLAH